MKLPDDPRLVHVIAAGVEEYRGGKGWHLSGPALDALQMAHWFYKQGVPASQIHLFHNVHPEASDEYLKNVDAVRGELAAAGIPLDKLPTRKALDDALDVTALAGLTDVPESVLWVYVSGHGVMSDLEERRYIVTADAAADSLRAVDIDQLARILRVHPSLARFSQQLLTVDACSTPTSRSYEPQYTTIGLRKADVQAHITQDVIYSSENWQEARIASGSTNSLFTAALLRALESSSLAGLETDELWKSLSNQVQEQSQPCVIFRNRPTGGREEAVGGRGNFHLQRIQSLSTILCGQEIITLTALYPLFNEATRLGDRGNLPDSTERLVQRLDDIVQVSGRRLKNSEWFALRLAMDLANKIRDAALQDMQGALKLRTALEGWLSTVNQAEIRDEQERIKVALASEPVLLIDIGDEEFRVWFRTNQWRSAAPPAPRAATLEETLRAAWAIAVQANMPTRRCRVEVAIAFAEFASVPFGLTLDGPRKLGHDYPASLRMRDRWGDGSLYSNWTQSEVEGAQHLDGPCAVDWLHSRAPAQRSRLVAPATWLCIHEAKADPWREWLRDHLEQGTIWLLFCDETLSEAALNAVDAVAKAQPLRNWGRVVRDLAAQAEFDHPVVAIADHRVDLPAGVIAPLTIPGT